MLNFSTLNQKEKKKKWCYIRVLILEKIYNFATVTSYLYNLLFIVSKLILVYFIQLFVPPTTSSPYHSLSHVDGGGLEDGRQR